VRGLGLIMGFCVPSGGVRDALLAKMSENGLLGLSCGDRTVRFRPHLAVTEADVDLCLELTEKSLRNL